jgi:hypothetical protein
MRSGGLSTAFGDVVRFAARQATVASSRRRAAATRVGRPCSTVAAMPCTAREILDHALLVT